MQSHRNYDQRPLGRAMHWQDYYLIKLLLKHGADPNLIVNRYSPALVLAGNKKLAELLLKHGADVNARGGYPLLHTVFFELYDEADLAQLYIDNGASVNAVDEEGNTLLHLLSNYLYWKNDGKWLKKAQILLAAGADVEIKNKEGKTAIDILNDRIAKTTGSKEFLEKERKRGRGLLKILLTAKSQRVSKL